MPIPREGIKQVEVTLPSSQEPIAEVTIPGLDEEAVLVVRLVDSQPRNGRSPVTQVLDLVVTAAGGDITTFSGEPVRLCFVGVRNAENRCLGFVNKRGAWECEDYCLSTSDDKVCGNSSHLTNFALLLDNEGGSSSRCGASSQDWRLVWASAALVGVAICVVLIAIAAYEIRYRMAVRADDARLTRAFVTSPVGVTAAAAADAAAAGTPASTACLFYDE